MPIFDGLGSSLRWLRERQQRRQYQVAASASITKAMLSAYETGKQKPSLDTLEKILAALGCDLDDLHNALQIVNGRPAQPRAAGATSAGIAGIAGSSVWPPAASPRPGFGPAVDLQHVLGLEEPVPPQEERALTEMLSGFHKLLRYLHDRLAETGAGLPPADATLPGTP